MSNVFLPLVMHFSFVSSLVNMPFDRTDNATTIYRCNATNRYDSIIVPKYSDELNEYVFETAVVSVLRLGMPVDGV